jgi:senataxin
MFSLATLHREYAALVALPYYDMSENILHPRLSRKPAINPTDVQQAMSTYAVNEPQAVAILSALQAKDFILIQG